jgi:hypothetical protein
LLSDYLSAGVVLGAAMLSLGSLARALPGGSASLIDRGGGLMVILAAFVGGLGVFAVTYGMSVMFIESAAGTTAALAILLPAAAAGIPAVLWTRPGQRNGVRALMALMLIFIGALACLAVVLALLAWLVSDVNAFGLDILTLLAAAVMGAGTLGIGFVGARDLKRLGMGIAGRQEADDATVHLHAIILAAVLSAVAFVAYMAAMAMFFMRE